MRLTLLTTAAVLAASIGLSACSSGSSQAVPGGAQTAPMAKSGAHLVAVGAHPDAACGSQFITCVTISKKSPGEVEICIQYSTGTCPYPGTWSWQDQVQVTKTGKPFKGIKSNISPNPGNPVYFTYTEKKKLKSSKGKYKYQDVIEACDSSSQCLTGAIGIATAGKKK